MKKNNMFRIASVLLVAVLLSTCAISGAFAKYYTNGEASDAARVAAFGINVSVEGDEAAFSQWYKDTKVESTDATATVAGAAKVIAPGTKGDLASYAISGTAEVDVAVAVELEVNLSAEFDAYCPIVFFVGGDAFYVGKDGITTTAKLEEAVSAAVSETVEAGTLADYTSAITWEWVFDENDSRLQPTTDGEGQPVAAELAGLILDDAKDTELARAAYEAINAVPATAAPTISFNLTASVTQID